MTDKRSKKLLCLVLGVFWQVSVYSQGYFCRRFDALEQQRADFAWALEAMNDGTYCVIGTSPWQDSVYSSAVIYTLRFTAEGELLEVDRHEDEYTRCYPGWSNSSGSCAGGGFVVGGSRSVESATKYGALFVYDEEGQVDTVYSFGADGDEWIGRQAKQTLDGGYVLCGDVFVTNGNGFLLRTDSLGALLWAREYGGPNSDYLVSVDIAGSGFYIAGAYNLGGGNYQRWVSRLEGQGDVQWERRMGNSFDDGNAHCMTTSDGHVVICGAQPTMNGSGGPYFQLLAKLDSLTGQTIWERRYGAAMVNSVLFAVKEITPFGDLIATGQATLGPLQENGVLLRTAANGDSLWMRYYQYSDSLIAGGAGQLRDVLPTPDGGFIAVGAAYGVSQNGQSYGQDVWVIKVDSMGCLEPGCHLITGIESQVTNLKGALTVSPNPVRAGEAVQVSISLPPSITPQGPLRLTVVSSEGRVVQEQYVAIHSSALTLHPSFAPGLYHLHICDATRWLAGAKLMVE